MNALEVRSISLQFGGIVVLNQVSLAVARGELLALIGPNGAGKTSVFNCISGIYRPSGEILLDGKTILALRPSDIAQRGVARTFQHAELVAEMSVIDNLLAARHSMIGTGIFSEMLNLPGARRIETAHRQVVAEILDLVDMGSLRDRTVADLPFGTQKILGFARALAMNPQVLLLDEPSAGLTGEERLEMARFIRKIRKKLNLAIIWIEHDMKMVAELADRVVVLDYGRMLATGTANEVLQDPNVVSAYLGTGLSLRKTGDDQNAAQ